MRRAFTGDFFVSSEITRVSLSSPIEGHDPEVPQALCSDRIAGDKPSRATSQRQMIHNEGKNWQPKEGGKESYDLPNVVNAIGL
jgi:hypothetical protein